MKTITTYITNLSLFVAFSAFAFADAPDWSYDPGSWQFTA